MAAELRVTPASIWLLTRKPMTAMAINRDQPARQQKLHRQRLAVPGAPQGHRRGGIGTVLELASNIPQAAPALAR